MAINTREQGLARIHQVIFSEVLSEGDIQKLGVEADAELFQKASDWLKDHFNYGLVEVGYHQPSIGASREEGTRLILYVEPL